MTGACAGANKGNKDYVRHRETTVIYYCVCCGIAIMRHRGAREKLTAQHRGIAKPSYQWVVGGKLAVSK